MTDPVASSLLQGPSTILILANMVPVVGVFFFGWDAFDVVFLYWLENVVIGIFTVLKIVMAGGTLAEMADFGPVRWQKDKLPPEVRANVDQSMAHMKLPAAMKLFLVPFFIVHYGLFTLVHGVFIVALLKLDWTNPATSPVALIQSAVDTTSWMLWLAVGSLLAEHGRSFWVDYVGSGRYKTTNAMVQMFTPYGRIVVMHLAIIASGFLMVFLKLPRLIVVVLIALKIGFELFQQGRAKG